LPPVPASIARKRTTTSPKRRIAEERTVLVGNLRGEGGSVSHTYSSLQGIEKAKDFLVSFFILVSRELTS